MGKMEAFAPPPPAAVSRLLATFDREQLAGFIEVAIGLLDVADGDTDGEETDAEDSFVLSWIARGNATGPGCSVSDAGGAGEREDDEEDDPSGLCDEDGINTNLQVQRRDFGPGCTISDDGGCNVEDQAQVDDGEHGMTPDWGLDQTKALPDMMVLQSDLANTRAHRNYIRRRRCDKLAHPSYATGATYRLREDN